jgi:NAD-dependent deacetylase
MQVSNAQPNSVHMALASWEKRGLSVEVVTQNIDDLHERAGTTCVYHVHGAISTSTCQQCDKQVQTKTLMQAVQSGHIPYCECGGVFKPDVTFFGESLPDEPFNKAMKAFTKADVVLILGTSLGVYPAAALPEFRRRIAKLAILNIRPTPLDREADLVIHDDLASVFATLLEKM